MKIVVLFLIRLYQITISNGLFKVFYLGGCRFSPTCSQYTYQTVAKYGTIKGLLKGIKRLSKCHPFSKGGFDPVK